MGKVYFLDVTNRDGVQAARLEMSKLQRTMVNHYLGQMGVYQSEFGFPFIWAEHNYIEANLELKEMGAMEDLVLAGWCRAVAGDVEKALKYEKMKYLSLSIPTSDQMNQIHLHRQKRIGYLSVSNHKVAQTTWLRSISL